MEKKIKGEPKAINVCYVQCYKDPGYTRTQTLIKAIGLNENIELTVITNKKRNLFRYAETIIKFLRYRLRDKPDLYVIAFRGYEIFWILYPFMRGSKIITDEFINLHDWLVNEHKILKEGRLPIKLVDKYMRWILDKCSGVLTDTELHKQLCHDTYNTPLNKIHAIPVGADDSMFFPRKSGVNKKLEVFFYGNMLPLHGLNIILESIKKLGSRNDIHFTIVGGRGSKKALESITGFLNDNELQGMVTHIPWVEYEKLPNYISRSDLSLGGPFGGTGQARRVITGKTYQFIAMGKPTVVGKLSEENRFEDKVNCIEVNQASVEELESAFLWALNNRKKLKIIGENAKQLYSANFSNKAIAQNIKVILLNLVSV